jgi:hypothetical protein
MGGEGRAQHLRKSIILLGAVAGLSACGSSSEDAASNEGANAAMAAKPKTAYCFFKDPETKDWKAKLDKDGNVVVTGKALAEDARYKAVMAPATISGTSAEIAPTITTNDTGFAAPGNWWGLKQTIPNSQALTNVSVKCGDETLARLSVPRKK